VSFKENLKKKISIDSLTGTAVRSVGTPGMSHKVDKNAVRALLSLSPFIMEKRRDLELYFLEVAGGTGEVLVLDNELPLYTHTTVDDVTLRRSPELKEMISIRNIIKILNDSDILLHKGRETLRHIQQRALELLDLRYEEADIEQLADEGLEALAGANSDQVMEILDLFVEIMGCEPVPVEFAVNDYEMMFGACEKKVEEGQLFNWVFMYNEKSNELKLIRQNLIAGNKVSQDLIRGIAQGKISPNAEGFGVFRFLVGEALKNKGPTIH